MLNEYTGFFVCLFVCLFFNARLEQSKYTMIIFLHLKIKSETQFLTQKSLKSVVAVSILLT